MTLSRRSVLAGAAAIVAARPASAQPALPEYPFALGVASGDPLADGIVLWTRLAPRPLGDPDGLGGMPPVAVAVEWQVARDEAMREIVQRGVAAARPERAHSVHVEVEGLEPDRWYWYRFVAGRHESPIGRTRTLPAAGAEVRALRFAFGSCQNWEGGHYAAYRDVVRRDVDLFVHLGDYIYEVSFGGTVPRRHDGAERIRTLAQYRNRYALYKSDPALQAAHQALPWLVVPDNHDTTEDGALDAATIAQRAVAFQAWVEHMPVRGLLVPGSAALQIYRAVEFGDLARIVLLDTRQFRADQNLCPPVDRAFGFGLYRAACAGSESDRRSVLGPEQEAWLAARLATQGVRWNAIGSSVQVAGFNLRHGDETAHYLASWDSYPAARRRRLAAARAGAGAPVFISGDLHSFWTNVVADAVGDRRGAAIAPEFLGGAISSGWPAPLDQPIRAALTTNPQVRFYESQVNGYALCELTPATWRTEYRIVTDVNQPDAPSRTLASFVVERGNPEPRRV